MELVKNHGDGYALSIIENARQKGLMREGTALNIKSQLMQLVKDLILDYTQGESSSVKEETAQSLLASICYAIDTASFARPEEHRYSYLMSKRIKEVYQEGLKLIDEMFRKAKAHYSYIMSINPDIPIEFYSFTLKEGIPAFFRNYQKLYAAQETPGDFDYPVALDDMSLKGILYVQNYLMLLKNEILFIRLFPLDKVIKLLADYGRSRGIPYSTAYVNVFELCYNQAYLLALAHKPVQTLMMTSQDAEELKERYRFTERSRRHKQCKIAFNLLLNELEIEDVELISMLRIYYDQSLSRLDMAFEYGQLNQLVIGLKENDSYPVHFRDGQSLGQEEFKRIIERMKSLPSVDEKLLCLIENIHGFRDFIDVLEADVFYDKDFIRIFRSLNKEQQALLLKYTKGVEPSFYTDNTHRPSRMHPWQEVFYDFLKEMDGKERHTLQCLSDSLYLDDGMMLQS